MNSRNVKVLVVDDDESLLASVRRILRSHVTITTTTDPVQALRIIECQGPFAIVISDFRMPFMNGIELFSNIIKLDSKTQRIMLTGCAELQMAIDAINHGKITAFLTKPTPAATLRQVVLDAIRIYNETAEKKHVLQPPNKPIENISDCLPLTIKETEVLTCLTKGYSNDEIADELNITVGTVKTHINNLFGKMNVNSRSKIVAKAVEIGLMQSSVSSAKNQKKA